MSNLKLQDIFGHAPDPRTPRAGEMNLSPVLYGIEIELENVRTCPPCKYWQWTNDGSLRNNGKELSLRVPLGGQDLEEALEELSVTLGSIREAAAPVEATARCSVHCHVDFRDATVQDVVSFFVLWVLFESALYTIGGKDRYDSIYCPGVTNAQAQIKEANKLYTATRGEAVYRVCRNWEKYTGVNLSALNTQGSIEVRSHRGTDSSEDVQRWVSLMDRLQAYSRTHTPEEVVDTAESLGAEDVAREVFGDLSSIIVCDNFRRYFSTNLRNAHDVLHWHEIKGVQPAERPDIDAICNAILELVQE